MTTMIHNSDERMRTRPNRTAQALKAAGFYGLVIDPEVYEQDTGFYHVPIEAKYYEQTEV